MCVKCHLMKMSLSKQSSSEGQRHFQVLRSQARQIVYKFHNYFKELKSQGRRKEIIFLKTQELTANAFGIHRTLVSRVCREAARVSFQWSTKFLSPRKRLNITSKVTDLDDFEKDIVRTVLKFYDRGEYPTINKITNLLKDKISYSSSRSSTYIILKTLGFQYSIKNIWQDSQNNGGLKVPVGKGG